MSYNIYFLITVAIFHIPITAVWLPIRLIKSPECFTPWFSALFILMQTLMAQGLIALTYSMKGTYGWHVDILHAGADGLQKLFLIFVAVLFGSMTEDSNVIAATIWFPIALCIMLSIPILHYDEKPNCAPLVTVSISLILGIPFIIYKINHYMFWFGILFTAQAICNMLLTIFKGIHIHYKFRNVLEEQQDTLIAN